MAKKKEKVAKVKQQTKQLKKEKSKPTKKTKSNESQVKGKFVGNERGFGFVLYEGGVDIFIPPHSTNGALHGDEVICKPESRKKREGLDSDDNRLSGKIVDIIRREPIIGTFLLEGKQGFVRPIENKIPYVFSVPPKTIARFGLVDGHRVVFSVDKKHKPEE
ncbi:MAG: hypothetical protein FWC89_07115, partial [Defluviitaleaceae bacterium]|nr:hypothetical protein [Defluviitaleaceae bacterium]